jgi:hypothetical protein
VQNALKTAVEQLHETLRGGDPVPVDGEQSLQVKQVLFRDVRLHFR